MNPDDAQQDIIDSMVKLGVAGFVVEGLPPAGTIFIDQQSRLTELAKQGMPVVLTSRNAGSYDARTRPRPPFIGGDDLPAHKARILLQLAMKKTENLSGQQRSKEIQRLFNTH